MILQLLSQTLLAHLPKRRSVLVHFPGNIPLSGLESQSGRLMLNDVSVVMVSEVVLAVVTVGDVHAAATVVTVGDVRAAASVVTAGDVRTAATVVTVGDTVVCNIAWKFEKYMGNKQTLLLHMVCKVGTLSQILRCGHRPVSVLVCAPQRLQLCLFGLAVFAAVPVQLFLQYESHF